MTINNEISQVKDGVRDETIQREMDANMTITDNTEKIN